MKRKYDNTGADNESGTEWHLPGYNYMGPGTHLQSRLRRKDPPVNYADKLSKRHDIKYGQYKDPYWKTNKADYDMFWDFFSNRKKWQPSDYLTGYVGPAVIGAKHYAQKAIGWVEEEPKMAGSTATDHSTNQNLQSRSERRMARVPNAYRGRVARILNTTPGFLRRRSVGPGPRSRMVRRSYRRRTFRRTTRSTSFKRRRVGYRRRKFRGRGGYNKKNKKFQLAVLNALNSVRSYTYNYKNRCRSTTNGVKLYVSLCDAMMIGPPPQLANRCPNGQIVIGDCLINTNVDIYDATSNPNGGAMTLANMYQRNFYYYWRAKYTLNNNYNATCYITVYVVKSKTSAPYRIMDYINLATGLDNNIVQNSAANISQAASYIDAANAGVTGGFQTDECYGLMNDPVMRTLLAPMFSIKKKATFMLQPGMQKSIYAKSKKPVYVGRSTMYSESGTVLSINRKGQIDYIMCSHGELLPSSSDGTFNTVRTDISWNSTLNCGIKKKPDANNYKYYVKESYMSAVAQTLSVRGHDNAAAVNLG